MAAAVCAVNAARGETLYWDGNGATAPNPAGGAGTWDLANNNWWTGISHHSYATGSAPHDAVFGVSGGAVSLGAAVDARSLAFDVGGYSISSGSINLTGSGAGTVSVATGSATISSSISGAGALTKTGGGTLVLGGANSYHNLNIKAGVVSFGASDLQLGDFGEFVNPSVVTIDGGTLMKTGTNNLTTGFTRNFFIGQSGGTIDIAQVSSGSNTGLTISGALSGVGALRKTGVGTMRVSDAVHTFGGSLALENGVFRFNNNNDAGPEALRMARISFGTVSTTAGQLNIGGSGSSPDPEDTLGGGASDLRTGEWNSSSSGAGTILAATTNAAGVRGGARGHDLFIYALADGNFSGTVNNTATANAALGGQIGSASKNGNLDVRGIATQTLSGTTLIDNTMTVYQGATLKLTGTAAVTGGDVNLNVRGGTFVLDNTATNANNRFRDAGSVEPRGGGRVVLVGNNGGTSETMGTLQLGTHLEDPAKNRSGHLAVEVVHNGGTTAATTLTFTELQRDSGRSTIDFSARDGAGATMALGLSGNNPRVVLTIAPTLQAGTGLYENAELAGDVGWATVNSSAFATYGGNGVAPASTTPFASAGATDNAALTSSASVSSLKTVATLTVTPSGGGQTLDVTGVDNLETNAILLAGSNNFEIRNSGGGTGGLATSGNLYMHVPTASLKVSTPLTAATIVKSGGGTLELATAGMFAELTINGGVVRAAGSANLGSGTIEFRGGVIELTGGGTFTRDIGTGSNTINWNNTTEDRGGGGFAAKGSNVTVSLLSSGSPDLLWEQANFLESGYPLMFGSTTADARVDFTNNIKLNDLPNSYNLRELRVTDNPAVTTDYARVSGVISSDIAFSNGVFSDLLKTGDGTLELTAANTYLGGTVIAEGTLRVANDAALGDATGPYVLLGNRGGTASASLLTSAPVTIAREITVQAGSSGTVTLGSATADNATFAGNVVMHRNLTLTAPAGSTVTILGQVRNLSNSTITKTDAGTVRVNALRGGAVVADGGMLQVVASAGTSVLSGVAAGGGTIDLVNNSLVVQGEDVGSVFGLLQAGRGDGSWNGTNGITTSMTDATTGVLTTLAASTADDVGVAGGLWGGVTVNSGDVLVKYTWGGDADLNGELNGDDYFHIDSAILAQTPGFANGDFDYNGEINGDDYFILDSNILFAQNNPPFGSAGVEGASAGLAGLTSVPEPGSMGLYVATAGISLARRVSRRRRR